MFRLQSLALCLTYLSLWQVINAVDELIGYDDTSRNMYNDWDMENDPGSSAWTLSNGLQAGMVTKVAGGHTGGYSYKISGRSGRDNSVTQIVTGLTPNTNYYASMYIKLLTDNPSGYVTFFLMCKHGASQGSVAKLTYQRVAEYGGHFMQFGGDLKSTSTSASCWLRVTPNTVDYLIDTASFTELKKIDNPTEYLNNKIKEHRTSPLTIIGQMPADCDNGKVNIDLVRHEFGIGIAVSARGWNRGKTSGINLKKLVLDGKIPFNEVGFIYALKWQAIEGTTKGSRTFREVDLAITELLAHNMTIRAHTLMWAIKGTLPIWFQALRGNTVTTEAYSRCEYMMDHLKNKVKEYDVVNEAIHSHYLEIASDDKDFMKKIFVKAHEVDPDVRLCLNDFEIIRNGQYSSMIANQCEYLLQEGAPCDCIGIQGHMRDTPFDPEVIWNRLSIAGRNAGVPISITEFSVHNNDMAIRADSAELAIRIFMAHPKVKSFMFWSVGEQFGSFAQDYALTEGDLQTPNAAGERVFNMLQHEMTTKEEIYSTCDINHTIPYAFKGDYKLRVTCGGETRMEKDFSLGNEAYTVHF